MNMPNLSQVLVGFGLGKLIHVWPNSSCTPSLNLCNSSNGPVCPVMFESMDQGKLGLFEMVLYPVDSLDLDDRK